MKPIFPLVILLMSSTAFAEEKRQLDAHEHGVGVLDIALDGSNLIMEFHAPGADIVGFEHAAESQEDHASIDAAIAMLSKPLEIFALPTSAGCTVIQASAELEGDEEHHDDENHEEEHEEHAEEKGHTEFHAEYSLTCTTPAAIDSIKFTYFEKFENAREIEVQIVTATGAKSFEVMRNAPDLSLENLFQ